MLPPPAPEGASAAERLAARLRHICTYDRLLPFLLLLVVALACALMPIQQDTWWQLRAGRDMWTSHRVLLTDTYSYTVAGTFWPNHEWLSEIIYYGAYRVGGLALVTLLATAVIMTAWLIVWHLTSGPVRTRFVLMALVLVPASGGWAPRPHAFSLLFLMVTVLLLVRRRYWWLPPLFVVWANCHGGVLLGLAVLAAGLATTSFVIPSIWRRASVVFGLCLLATVVTPLGASFWPEMLRSLSRIHSYPLDEWRRPAVSDLTLLPFWLLAAGFVLAVVRSLRSLLSRNDLRAPVLTGIGLVLLPMAFTAVRNVGPFAMVAVPAVSAMLPGPWRLQPHRARVERPFVNLAMMSSAASLVAATVVSAYAMGLPRLAWTPLPAASLAALDRCPGHLYNRYDEGGYLIWFAPERKVFLDGRQDPYPRDLVLDQIRVETTGSYQDVFARYQIQCAYLPTSSPVAARLTDAGWSALYRDTRWVVLSPAPAAQARNRADTGTP